MSQYHLWRALHLCAALYNLVYVYSPLHEWEWGLFTVRVISMPLLVISGALLVRSRKKSLRSS